MDSEKVFLLGGNDLEMETVRNILKDTGNQVFDKNLPWGAKASAYAAEIKRITDQGRVPVLVELELDMPLPKSAIVIDHHGNRSGEKASLLQILDLLGLEPTREYMLIAANDCGYIPGMKAAGASEEEIVRIRQADRKAQGVTDEMETSAKLAILGGVNKNGVFIVKLPHKKFSPVTDRMFSSWPNGKENLIVVCEMPGEIQEMHYFGAGHICKAVKEGFSGWGGGKGYGDTNGSGFCGCKMQDCSPAIELVVKMNTGS